LPNCDETLYTASVSAARFRPCDLKNLGLTTLCTLSSEDAIYPPIWGSSVLGQYEKAKGGKDKMPDYITSNVETNRRSYINKAQVQYMLYEKM
jgi:hypothetical protein